jgi:hypothetical protein
MTNEKKIIKKYLKLLNFEKGTHGFLMLSYLVKEHKLSLITSIEEELPKEREKYNKEMKKVDQDIFQGGCEQFDIGFNRCLEKVKKVLSNYKQ